MWFSMDSNFFDDEYTDSSWLTQEPSLESTQWNFDIASGFLGGMECDYGISLEEAADVIMSDDEMVESL